MCVYFYNHFTPIKTIKPLCPKGLLCLIEEELKKISRRKKKITGIKKLDGIDEHCVYIF